MRARAESLLLRADPPSTPAGIVAALLGVGAITGVIYPLRIVSPPTSNGVLYLLVVLLVSTGWGLWLGLATSVLSAAAFNFFHLPPTGQFTIANGRDWVGLAVFLAAAVVASSLADVARARAREADLRRREADLAADLARLLLSGASVEEALSPAADRLAEALGLPWAAIELGDAAQRDGARALALGDDPGRVGTLFLPAELPDHVAEQLPRVVPALQAPVAAALERDQLQSEVVETRALRRSDELKTALLRAVSHDLRSPLTAILTAADALAAAGISTNERADLSAAVTAEARRLSNLVDKLLDLSRLQAGVGEPRRDWSSVEEIIRVAVDELGFAPDRFRLSIDPDLPLVRADAAQLERAFANLLENAARYSGGHPVSVRARAVGRRLMVRIVDRGPGISAEEIARIFEPFYRPATDRHAHPGSGLGLAIVRGFVEANGGRVWAESLPGQGATFVVAFPLAADDAAPDVPEVPAKRAGAP
ncbi:MAG: two-component system, OmpR family, sensor histidine kinase KdpD [Solirubrobacteraceae bacterium]|jgi:two-component system sensor histidine kinase KdpD|nr:two-component system, OmpR family, sensor histidine kinase KdpD [Solirubrobacteraceae bacterium]